MKEGLVTGGQAINHRGPQRTYHYPRANSRPTAEPTERNEHTSLLIIVQEVFKEKISSRQVVD